MRPAEDKDYYFCHNLGRRNLAPFYKRHGSGWVEEYYRNDWDKKFVLILESGENPVGYIWLELKESREGESVYLYIHDVELNKNIEVTRNLGPYIFSSIVNAAKVADIRIVEWAVFKDHPNMRIYRKLEGLNIVWPIKTLDDTGEIILRCDINLFFSIEHPYRNYVEAHDKEPYSTNISKLLQKQRVRISKR